MASLLIPVKKPYHTHLKIVDVPSTPPADYEAWPQATCTPGQTGWNAIISVRQVPRAPKAA